MPEGTAGTMAGGAGRETLPGIPGYINRVSAETIWRQNCDNEVAFMQRRQAKPVKARENFGAMHGFEVIRHPTYISVAPARTRSTGARAMASTTGFLEARANANAAADFGRPTSQSGRKPVEAADESQMVMPKYLTYSMPHMYELQANPQRSATSRSLHRVLSTPVFAKHTD